MGLVSLPPGWVKPSLLPVATRVSLFALPWGLPLQRGDVGDSAYSNGLLSPLQLGMEGAITEKFSVAVTPCRSVMAETTSITMAAEMGAGYSRMFGASS